MSTSCSTDLPQIRLRPFFLVMLEITMNRCDNGKPPCSLIFSSCNIFHGFGRKIVYGVAQTNKRLFAFIVLLLCILNK